MTTAAAKANNAENMKNRLNLVKANHIILQTEPYYSMAGAEFHQLTEQVRDAEHNPMQCLDLIEAAIIDWNQSKTDILPASWQNSGEKRQAIGQVIVANTMESLFNPIDDMDGAPTTCWATEKRTTSWRESTFTTSGWPKASQR